VILLKNTFEEKMHQIKAEREILLNILHAAEITHVDDKAIETLKNVDMKQFIINNIKNVEHEKCQTKIKTNYKKLKLVVSQ
jgi:hypothetical protein